MTEWVLPIGLPTLAIDQVSVEQTGLEVRAHLSATSANCPSCGQPSAAVHSYYQRTLRDLPVSENGVQLVRQVRRFRCRNPNCQRRTFAEPLTAIAARFARRTLRLTHVFRRIGLALGGQAGQRLAQA
jgi:transposase